MRAAHGARGSAPIADTEQVREVRIVARGVRRFAFYRYRSARSQVWRSVRISTADAAIANGYGTFDGFRGPVVPHVAVTRVAVSA